MQHQQPAALYTKIVEGEDGVSVRSPSVPPDVGNFGTSSRGFMEIDMAKNLVGKPAELALHLSH